MIKCIEYLINEIIKKIKIEDIEEYNKNNRVKRSGSIKINKSEYNDANDKSKNCC